MTSLVCRYAARWLLGSLVFVAASVSAFAQYPNKPILIIAPFSAGGDSDLAARNLTGVLPKYTGQNAIVLNKVGASGAIGSEYVKKATPDGYTLLLARVGSQATLPALKPDLEYKWNDFTFLGLLELNPYVCAVRGDSPYKTFGDLIEGIRKNPGRLKYSTAGVGTIHEMGPQMLFDILKLGKEAAIQVPYKGGGDATVALISGQVDINCTNLGTALGFIKSGQLRALMTTTPERYKEIPNVPTAREGLPAARAHHRLERALRPAGHGPEARRVLGRSVAKGREGSAVGQRDRTNRLGAAHHESRRHCEIRAGAVRNLRPSRQGDRPHAPVIPARLPASAVPA
jgi:tripartite-type tricarboxylate transporter receptor subunit TctC